MKSSIFSWSEEKNGILKRGRNISFEEIIIAIQKGDLLEIIPNPSNNYKEQECFVVSINNYAYIVPYVENDDGIFLKTIYPSRKYTKVFFNK
jgi:hypothetical protein